VKNKKKKKECANIALSSSALKEKNEKFSWTAIPTTLPARGRGRGSEEGKMGEEPLLQFPEKGGGAVFAFHMEEKDTRRKVQCQT